MLTFSIMRAAGDPVNAYLQNPERAPPEVLEQIREKYHLNDPIWVQYIYWLKGVLSGEMGYSPTAGDYVTAAIADRFPATFELSLTATFFAVVIGILVGTRAAVRVNSGFDQSTRVITISAVSIPVFWLGIMLLMVFYHGLGWAPAPVGRVSLDYTLEQRYTNFLLIDSVLNLNWHMFWDVVAHLVLPAITLAFASTAIIVRMMRSSMLEVLNAEYVRTARSKGLPESVVIKKHARRNALIPTVTVVGLTFGGLLGGAVLTETIFNWPGLGQWSAQAALNLDSAGIMGFTLLTALIYVLANLIVDLVYAQLDPRVRLG
jgi:peptide/nickel transport system permease protein